MSNQEGIYILYSRNWHLLFLPSYSLFHKWWAHAFYQLFCLGAQISVYVCAEMPVLVYLWGAKAAPYPDRLGTALPSTATQPPAAWTEEIRAACSSNAHYLISCWAPSPEGVCAHVMGLHAEIPELISVEVNRRGELASLSVLLCMLWGNCDLWSFVS